MSNGITGDNGGEAWQLTARGDELAGSQAFQTRASELLREDAFAPLRSTRQPAENLQGLKSGETQARSAGDGHSQPHDNGEQPGSQIKNGESPRTQANEENPGSGKGKHGGTESGTIARNAPVENKDKDGSSSATELEKNPATSQGKRSGSEPSGNSDTDKQEIANHNDKNAKSNSPSGESEIRPAAPADAGQGSDINQKPDGKRPEPSAHSKGSPADTGPSQSSTKNSESTEQGALGTIGGAASRSANPNSSAENPAPSPAAPHGQKPADGGLQFDLVKDKVKEEKDASGDQTISRARPSAPNLGPDTQYSSPGEPSSLLPPLSPPHSTGTKPGTSVPSELTGLGSIPPGAAPKELKAEPVGAIGAVLGSQINSMGDLLAGRQTRPASPEGGVILPAPQLQSGAGDSGGAIASALQYTPGKIPLILSKQELPASSGDSAHPIPGTEIKLLRDILNNDRIPSSTDVLRNQPLPTPLPDTIKPWQNLIENHQAELPKVLTDPTRLELPFRNMLLQPVQSLQAELPGKIIALQTVAPTTADFSTANPALPVVSTDASDSRQPAAADSAKPKTNFADELPRQKTDAQIEAKIQSLLSIMAELKPIKNDDTELNARPVSGLKHEISRAELPVLPQFLRAAFDISVNRQSIPEQIGRSFDPSAPLTQSLFRQTAGLDPLLLKDIIALSNRGFDPADPSALRGLRAEPMSLSGLRDPLSGVRGAMEPIALGPPGKIDPLTGKMVDGKGEPITGIKVLDGKLEPSYIGSKGSEIIDPRTGAKIIPADPAGDKALHGTDRKDLADKNGKEDSDAGKDLISMLAAADKSKGKKPEKDGKDKNDSKDKKEEQQTRRKYIVREGDILESIAENLIGDSRFSLLLEMINRGGIRYKWEGSNRKPLLSVGQLIWLPTPNEVKAHRAMFFTRKAKTEINAESSSDSSAIPAFDDRTVPVSETEKIFVDMPTVEITNAAAEELPAPTVQPEAKGAVREENAPVQDQNISSSLAYTPSWVEIQQMISRNRIESAAAARVQANNQDEQTGTAVLNRAASNKTFKQIDGRNRIVMQNDNKEENHFSAKLEREIDGVWTTVAYYESRAGKSVRYLNKSNGSRRAFYLNLPSFVVKEMALKDFNKNWKNYGENFEQDDPAEAYNLFQGNRLLKFP